MNPCFNAISLFGLGLSKLALWFHLPANDCWCMCWWTMGASQWSELRVVSHTAPDSLQGSVLPRPYSFLGQGSMLPCQHFTLRSLHIYSRASWRYWVSSADPPELKREDRLGDKTPTSDLLWMWWTMFCRTKAASHSVQPISRLASWLQWRDLLIKLYTFIDHPTYKKEQHQSHT